MITDFLFDELKGWRRMPPAKVTFSGCDHTTLGPRRVLEESISLINFDRLTKSKWDTSRGQQVVRFEQTSSP